MEGLIIDRMDRNESLVTRYLNDSEFQDVLFTEMAKRIYDEARKAHKDALASKSRSNQRHPPVPNSGS
jgi:hypothetical protein